MHLHHLTSVDGEIVFDLDPDVVAGAVGRIYLREGLTSDDAALLARAATYRAALFEERVAGAAVTIRPRLIDSEDDTLGRLHEEITPLEQSGRFTAAAEPADPARGIVAAVESWFGGLDGRSVAVHGFDTGGRGVAGEIVRRGGRLVGVSNISGAVADSAGLDLDRLLAAEETHGPLFVTHLGLELHLPDELLELAVDAVVLTGGVGSIDADRARRVRAGVVVPTSDAAYTTAGLDDLRRRKIVPLPDVVTTAGPMLEARAPLGLSPTEKQARADRLIAERVTGARNSKVDPIDYATTLADTFLATWVPTAERPTEPAIAVAR